MAGHARVTDIGHIDTSSLPGIGNSAGNVLSRHPKSYQGAWSQSAKAPRQAGPEGSLICRCLEAEAFRFK